MKQYINKTYINNKGTSPLAIIGSIIAACFLIVLIVIAFVAGYYNTFVNVDQSVEKSWGNVETAYQKRFNLWPALIETVKGSASFESQTYVAVAEARSSFNGASTVADKQKYASEFDSAISRLLLTYEAYPDLKSNQNFLGLMDEFSSTENSIKWEVDQYNGKVQEYKVTVKSFPGNVFAGMFGFSPTKWNTFESVNGANVAPVVQFSGWSPLSN